MEDLLYMMQWLLYLYIKRILFLFRFWIIGTILSGAIYFQEIDNFNKNQKIMFPISICITLFGLWILTACKQPHPKETEKDKKTDEKKDIEAGEGKEAEEKKEIKTEEVMKYEEEKVQEERIEVITHSSNHSNKNSVKGSFKKNSAVIRPSDSPKSISSNHSIEAINISNNI